MAENFELGNLGKYIENEDKQILKFDFILKIFVAAFFWKNLIAEIESKPISKERREMLRNKNTEGYKNKLNQIVELENTVFDSCLRKVISKLEILDSTF